MRTVIFQFTGGRDLSPSFENPQEICQQLLNFQIEKPILPIRKINHTGDTGSKHKMFLEENPSGPLIGHVVDCDNRRYIGRFQCTYPSAGTSYHRVQSFALSDIFHQSPARNTNDIIARGYNVPTPHTSTTPTQRYFPQNMDCQTTYKIGYPKEPLRSSSNSYLRVKSFAHIDNMFPNNHARNSIYTNQYTPNSLESDPTPVQIGSNVCEKCMAEDPQSNLHSAGNFHYKDNSFDHNDNGDIIPYTLNAPEDYSSPQQTVGHFEFSLLFRMNVILKI